MSDNVQDADTSHPAKKRKRPYGVSCDACRRRRKKCPGRDEEGISRCTYCPGNGLKCTFSDGPVHPLDKALSDLSNAKALLSSLTAADDNERTRLLEAWTAEGVSTATKSPSGSSSIPLAELSAAPGVASFASQSQESVGKSASELRSLTGTGADEAGLAVDQGDKDLGHLVLFSELTGTDTTIECESYYLKWMQSAREAAARECILPPAAGVQLLQAYFSWNNHRFLLPEAETVSATILPNPNYLNDCLLYAIYAFSSRLAPSTGHLTEKLAARAHLELGFELTRPLTLPTVQALMLLSAYHPSQARLSQSLTLLGLAHKMLQNPQLRALVRSTEQQRRQYLRAEAALFQWSNMLAIYINRPPTVPPVQNLKLSDIASHEEIANETRPWKPQDGSVEAVNFDGVGPPVYDLSTFIAGNDLHEFLYSILTQLYSGVKLKKMAAHAYVRDTFESFSAWRARVKPQIVIPLERPSSLQPPTNIVHFSLMLRIIPILLFRKFDAQSASSMPMPEATQIVQRNTDEIYETLLRSGSKRRLRYAAIFAAELAAITDLRTFQHCASMQTKQILLPRLEMYEAVLALGESCCPGLPLVLETLRRQLNQAHNHKDVTTDAARAEQTSFRGEAPTSQLPAGIQQDATEAVPLGLPLKGDAHSSFSTFFEPGSLETMHTKLHGDTILREFGLDSGFMNPQMFLDQSGQSSENTNSANFGLTNDYGYSASGIWQDLWPDALALFNHDVPDLASYELG